MVHGVEGRSPGRVHNGGNLGLLFYDIEVNVHILRGHKAQGACGSGGVRHTGSTDGLAVQTQVTRP